MIVRRADERPGRHGRLANTARPPQNCSPAEAPHRAVVTRNQESVAKPQALAVIALAAAVAEARSLHTRLGLFQ